jgi:hypothetical protein
MPATTCYIISLSPLVLQPGYIYHGNLEDVAWLTNYPTGSQRATWQNNCFKSHLFADMTNALAAQAAAHAQGFSAYIVAVTVHLP